MYSKPIRELIHAFTKLPGVGSRTAERFVFSLLKSGKKDVAELTNALKTLFDRVQSCEQCWIFTDTSLCALCADKKRDQKILCVVVEQQDIAALEKTGQFQGRYHVLRGLVNPDKENTLEGLKIAELFNRIETEHISEVILALNPTLAGETTMMYLEKELQKINPKVTVSRLARGLAMGSDLQYADEITLGNALQYRRKQ